jgi:O-antigen ligase
LGIVVFEGLVGLVGVAWIIRCMVARSTPFPDLVKHPLVVPWVVWYACIVISMCVHGSDPQGYAHDIVLFRYPLFVVALLDISRRLPVARYLMYGLAAGVLLAALNTLCAHLFGHDLVGKPLIRYIKKKKEAARIAGMVAYVFPLFLAWGLVDKTLSAKHRNGVLGIAAMAFALVLVLRSRTPIIAGVAGCVFALFFIFKKRFSYLMIVIATGILIGIVGIMFYFREMYALQNFYDRIYIWKVSWLVWLEHPILGVGVSSFKSAFTDMVNTSGGSIAYLAPDGKAFARQMAYHAHNLVLMLLVTTGVMGLAAFSWLFVNCIRIISKNRYEWRLCLLSWPIILLTLGLTGYNIYDAWYATLFAYFNVIIGSAVYE